MVLKRLLDHARHTLGPIEKAVISVPQVFNEGQRQATRDAGRIAGLKEVDMVEEPVAAAIAYGKMLLKSGGFFDLGDVYFDQVVLVYDLGGGTFDATVMRLRADKEGEFKALATIGDTRLGGKDFDAVLVKILLDEFAKQSRYDPRRPPENKLMLQDVHLEAIKAKLALSELDTVVVNVSHDGKDYEIPVTRSRFETDSLPL